MTKPGHDKRLLLQSVYADPLSNKNINDKRKRRKSWLLFVGVVVAFVAAAVVVIVALLLLQRRKCVYIMKVQETKQ